MSGFSLAVAPTFRAEVEITPPGAGPLLKLPVVFRHQPKAKLRTWIDALPTRPAGESLAEVIESWEADKPYSAEALAELVENYPAPADELIRGYLRALTESRAKN